ncbi:MAG: hypothetical protein A3B86_00220 [Candidatus Yanofskybacteria bacterium RIFCSPHIGHO2_02_FULL_38_22b]|uniref:Glycosyl transferase family 1 domain-containing protein n=1 Tax=Candidatus Yanofskybacteria bacterium RIFCSPHIGHO2_02_FULL_38_22b TaxID=1802673 RepID=A0A1F8F3D7_9BACT|nr:MAG: hypothetical protein A2816_00155 [Candidatus Yanofskybacteria bacterium RIFCSPHIGHO2_01_FULL_39_44]OGN06779.1 MAG: hypothetical protein A3B86_00220 [Candidatus Yanofskybacteria bacterium RIFCSPHIGHO2_02_FULL_38_22b]
MNLLIVTQKVDENDQLLGFFIEWLKLFAKKFEKVTILCLEKSEYNLPENVSVISLGKDRGVSKLRQLFNFYFLIFTLRTEYHSVLVHMNPIWAALGGIVWKILNKKLYLWYTHKSVTLKLKIAEKFTNKIFTASPESFRWEKDYLIKSGKLIITGHGIDTELFKPSNQPKLEPEKLKILSVGRIAPVKNYETLIEAAKILKDKGVDFKVTMVGEAPLNSDVLYLASLKLRIKSLKLEENFDFIGKINHKELPKYYQSHDIFVHLSKTGSLDKVVLEAMACGIKVLSSNDSSRTFLPDNLIFGDINPAELADKVTAVKDLPVDPKLRNYVVQNHNLENLILKISDIIINYK